MGFLNACYTIAQFVRNNKCKKPIITCSEIDNNNSLNGESQLSIYEAGAAFILEESADEKSGFGNFIFRDFTNHIYESKWWAEWNGSDFIRMIDEKEVQELNYTSHVIEIISQLLEKEKISIKDVSYLLLPQ